MAEIAKVTPTHEAFIDWILMNPGATLAQMGAFFGYSPSWLSQVMNSDLFRAKLAERRGDVEARVSATIPERMASIAQVTLEKIQRHVEMSEDPAFLLETADTVLHRLGYAPQRAGTVNISQTNIQQNTQVLADRDALASARALMTQIGSSPALPERLEYSAPATDSLPTAE